MRVISGTARGTRLAALPGEEITRPTVDRVKEGMFSAVQFLLAGARVLDLFAGSGQLGIEALSRGAARCVFIDSSREACAVVRQNLRPPACLKKPAWRKRPQRCIWPHAGNGSILCCWTRRTVRVP